MRSTTQSVLIFVLSPASYFFAVTWPFNIKIAPDITVTAISITGKNDLFFIFQWLYNIVRSKNNFVTTNGLFFLKVIRIPTNK